MYSKKYKIVYKKVLTCLGLHDKLNKSPKQRRREYD